MEKLSTKEKILIAALDLFSEKGYEEASIDLIAEAVGIKGPSIYTHYKGKEAIFDSLLQLMEDRYSANFGNVECIGKLPETLEEFKNDSIRRVKFTMQDPQIRKIRKFCVKEQFRNAKMAELTTKHQITGSKALFARILENLIEKNLIKKMDVQMMAFELVAPVSLMVEIVDREPERLDEINDLLEKHLDHFIEIYRQN